MKRVGIDVLGLFLLLMARVRIDTLADLVLPTRLQDVGRLPLVRSLFPDHALTLLQDWLSDPLVLLSISLAFAAFFLYVVVDLLRDGLGPARTYGLKLALILAIVGLTVFAGSAKLIALRHATGPAAYCHDGGVIQTEEATKLFLAGRNPYVEDYEDTPLAEWGLDLHSAVYHYPYLPWTFIFSAPFYALSGRVLGWFDERFVYLILFALTLLLAAGLTTHRTARLGLIMVLGLNPIMGSDVIFGQNDVFVLFWLVLALWLLPRRAGETPGEWRYWLSAGAAGLACASKPTAWFLLPFYLLALADIRFYDGRFHVELRRLVRWLPLIAIFLALVGPYLIWNGQALIDDVWRWANGTSQAPYQIRGWGAAIWVLAAGAVESRLSYFPFWLPQLIVCVPLLFLTLRRQLQQPGDGESDVAAIAWHGAILLFAYSFTSRFFNENYVGFLAALLAIAYLAGWERQRLPRALPSSACVGPAGSSEDRI